MRLASRPVAPEPPPPRLHLRRRRFRRRRRFFASFCRARPPLPGPGLLRLRRRSSLPPCRSIPVRSELGLGVGPGAGRGRLAAPRGGDDPGRVAPRPGPRVGAEPSGAGRGNRRPGAVTLQNEFLGLLRPRWPGEAKVCHAPQRSGLPCGSALRNFSWRASSVRGPRGTP